MSEQCVDIDKQHETTGQQFVSSDNSALLNLP